MKLISSDGAEFTLRPIRYQFPVIKSRGRGWDWDANWLIIRGDVKTADGKAWSFEDASLTTREAQELGQWLRAVVAGVVAPSPFDGGEDERLQIFTEPNLALSLEGRTEDRARIRVHLSLEALPPWLEEAERPEIFEFFVLLDVALDDLTHASSHWVKELAPFPER